MYCLAWRTARHQCGKRAGWAHHDRQRLDTKLFDGERALLLRGARRLPSKLVAAKGYDLETVLAVLLRQYPQPL